MDLALKKFQEINQNKRMTSKEKSTFDTYIDVFDFEDRTKDKNRYRSYYIKSYSDRYYNLHLYENTSNILSKSFFDKQFEGSLMFELHMNVKSNSTVFMNNSEIQKLMTATEKVELDISYTYDGDINMINIKGEFKNLFNILSHSFPKEIRLMKLERIISDE